MMNMSKEEIETRFSYHSPTSEHVELFELMRSKVKELGYLINEVCPESREKSMAFSKLEECLFHINSSIVRRS